MQRIGCCASALLSSSQITMSRCWWDLNGAMWTHLRHMRPAKSSNFYFSLCFLPFSKKVVFTLQWTEPGCRYSQLRTDSGTQRGERRNESKRRKLKPLIVREAEASVDYKPKCPVKNSRGCSLYLQQHSRESGKGQSEHEEKKAPHFLTPAIITEGCKAVSHLIQGLFTAFYNFLQKASA